MQHSTGLPSLDNILKDILHGDNIVWQIDSIDDYLPYVHPFCKYAKATKKKLIYFRFAKHKKLINKDLGAQIYKLYPEEGFEKFITEIHKIIKHTGRNAYYVFDSLSELAIDCYSERMTGNFFMLTCPYLYELGCIAYFTVIRNYHSYHAASPIAQTTQLLIDIYNHKNKEYIHILKADKRYSPTMHMLHMRVGDDFTPIAESTTVSEVLTSGTWHGLQSASYRMVGLWDRRFIQAEEILESYKIGECSQKTVEKIFHRQLKQLISRDERIYSMTRKYLNLGDIIHTWKRTIGSGMIGGKAVGLLLARAILKKKFGRWEELMEAHDSFFVGSDIFYSFLVQNGCWHIRQKQKNPDTLFEGIEEVRKRILNGSFPDYIVKRFSDMLDYFGQTPIIVRSSSLLEDNFGNAFSGKYESIFCVNNGTQEQRLKEFLRAVRSIYASAMSREALAYRAQRGVLDKDEQMALIVQRVSGVKYENLFFPQLAGVGISFNSYVWDKDIDADSGFLRLVFGLGTRAVERHDDDYTRIIALNAPTKRPEGDLDEVIKFTQKRVDILNLKKNSFESSYFIDIVRENPKVPVEMFSLCEEKGDMKYSILNFDKVFSQTSLVKDIKKILKILKQAYGCNVDIEFTANFLPDCTYKLNLLQCRPHQAKEGNVILDTIPHIKKDNLILQAHGGVIGQSRATIIDRIIYVVPSVYGNLHERDRYAVARLIGKLIHYKEVGVQRITMLMGPGRWGTRMPSLGVPVSFSEINKASVVCELDIMREGLSPDLSMGTHFFNDMVEMDILYIGFFSTKKDNVLNDKYLMKLPNRLSDLVSDTSSLDKAVKVIHGHDLGNGRKIYLNADSMKQTSVLYIK